MYTASFNLGTLFGVKIGINISLLLLAGLLVFSLANIQFPLDLPSQSQSTYYTLGLVAAFMFFASVLWHELAHALMAQFFEIRVRQIVLNIIGGLAEIEQNPRKAHQEFWIAIIGPLSTLFLSGLFLLLAFVLGDDSPIGVMFRWLGRINLMLAGLNMIPGFPLDGGRVLRAAIWWITGKYMVGTRAATSFGQVFALGMVGFGSYQLVQTGDAFTALWFLFIAWFLWKAAKVHLDIARKWNDLKDIPISRALHQRIILDPNWSIIYAMDMMSIHGPTSVAPVMDGDKLVGIFSLESVIRIPRLNWGNIRVSHLMKSLGGIPAVHADTDLFDTLRQMEQSNADYMLVLHGAIPIGIVGRLDLIRLAERSRRMQTEPIG